MGCFQSHDLLAASAGLRASQCCAGVATTQLSAFALRRSMMSFNEADMPIMDHNGVPAYFLKGKKTTRGHREAGMVKQKEDGGVLDVIMGIAKASRKDFETNRIVICGRDGTTKIAMMEKTKVAKHHSEWHIYTYAPTYLGQNVAKDDEYLCCCDVEDLLRQEAQRLLSTTKRVAGGGGRGLSRGDGGFGKTKRNGEADSENDSSDVDSESSELVGDGLNIPGSGGLLGLGGATSSSAGKGNLTGDSTTSPRDVFVADAGAGSALLSMLKPDDIASARHGHRDPREQDQDTGKYTCSCPHKVYLFASIEKIESTRHSLVQHTRALPHRELVENTSAYASDLLENAPEGFIYRVFRSDEDTYEVWRAHPKIHHGPENWDRHEEMWVTKERLRRGGTLGKGANADGSFAFDPHLEEGKSGRAKKTKKGGGKGKIAANVVSGRGGLGGGGLGAGVRGGASGKIRSNGVGPGIVRSVKGGAGDSRAPATAWKTKLVRRDVNGKQFDARRPPPEIVGIVRERSPHFDFELRSRNGKRPDVKYLNALTRLGDDYLLEMVPGADPLGMILFSIAVDESTAEDMKIARAKIRSNKRKIREELGLKVDDDNAENQEDDDEDDDDEI